MKIEITVNKLQITTNISRLVVAENIGVWLAVINLDNEWEGFNKKITFYTDSVSKDVLIPTGSNTVEIPYEVLTPNTELRFTISGYSENGNKILHTKAMHSSVKIYAAGKYIGDNPESYTPELWEQVLAQIGTGGGGGTGGIVDQEYKPKSPNAQSGVAVAQAINETVGDIETVLDEIIALQESYIARAVSE